MELINGSIINYEKIITFWGVMKRAVKWTTTLQRTLTGRRALTGQQALMELTVKWQSSRCRPDYKNNLK